MWMSMDGQGTKWRRNIAENFNRLSKGARALETTDKRVTAYRPSEREREFTFANECIPEV